MRYGDMLDPEAKRLLEKMQERRVPAYQEIGLEAARAQLEEIPEPGHTAAVGSVQDRQVGPAGARVPIRVYQPRRRLCPAVVLYHHGGGWVLGSLDSHDKSCRRLCAAAGCTVVAVDYRLAPENPFPAGFEDSRTVLAWVAAQAESLGGAADAIVIAGDSAGGNIAAAVALDARHGGPPIALQILLYPSLEIGADTPSMARNADGYGLTRPMMEWFYDHYCPPGQRGDPRASPLLASDHSGVAPAHVIVAGYDPLHDEGVAYAAKLIAAGVPTTLSAYPGQIHGFYAMTRFLADARRAQAEVVESIWRATRPDERWGRDEMVVPE